MKAVAISERTASVIRGVSAKLHRVSLKRLGRHETARLHHRRGVGSLRPGASSVDAWSEALARPDQHVTQSPTDDTRGGGGEERSNGSDKPPIASAQHTNVRTYKKLFKESRPLATSSCGHRWPIVTSLHNKRAGQTRNLVCTRSRKTSNGGDSTDCTALRLYPEQTASTQTTALHRCCGGTDREARNTREHGTNQSQHPRHVRHVASRGMRSSMPVVQAVDSPS